MVAAGTARRRGGATKWVRSNLFSSRANGALTIVTVTLALAIVYSLGNFVFVSAEWESVDVNRRLLFLAIYPSGEEWRLWPPVMLFATVAGLGYGLWSRAGIREYVIGAGTAAFVFLFLVEGNTALLTAVMVGVAIASYLGGRRARDSRTDTSARRVAIGGGVAIIPFALLILNIGDGMRTTAWGGVMLNLMLATVGIGAGFPLGVLLALGRSSSLKVISFACTGFIEFVRAGPLILWLAMARFVLPDFLPSVGGLDDVSLVVRAMMVMAGFSAAYIAEVVRGGLQTIPRGQHEASDAIGLSTFQSTWFIVLPQALRSVIPALVNRFVSLWKDTSLVVVLGFVDLLGAARAIPAQPDFVGRQAEALLFAALIFWSVSFTMSRLSARIERQLGVGVR
ncbi:MAG TPA: amino acid ABC transporter permease [Dehalococcoidia bacterium]|jgi:general L-amino acid transport system permease protein|nr:amino acid ABC transporter permease [Dehalococcoidia bacterium]